MFDLKGLSMSFPTWTDLFFILTDEASQALSINHHGHLEIFRAASCVILYSLHLVSQSSRTCPANIRLLLDPQQCDSGFS